MNIDKISQDHELEGFCRGCLIKYDYPTDLLQYTEKNRRLYVYSTGLQVKRNDTFTFQLCKDCYVNMKLSCKFKKQCRNSDKQFKSFLRLKEISDIDLCTFLQNSDDALKIPLLSGSNTSANQKNRDDDNESICTSIQNFMTDILQGTEMPDTEARIIKEVIEEEADVFEESLDSHWLHDDVSIDTDFKLDFSFSPFSTLRSVNNDHCYTPPKQVESIQNSKNNHVKKVLEQLPLLQENVYGDSPKDISINGIENEALRDICCKTGIDIEEDYMQDNLIEECINANKKIPTFEADPNMPELIDDAENIFPVQNEIGIAVKNIDMNFENVPEVNKKNFYVLNDLSLEWKLEINDDHEKDHTISDNDFIKHDTTKCSIDNNLKQALESNNKEIPLEDLLLSPAKDFPEPAKELSSKIYDFPRANGVSTPKVDDFLKAIETSTPKTDNVPEAIDASTLKYEDFSKALSVSTPTITAFADNTCGTTPMINNILFGEKLELDDESNNGHNMGQCIAKFDNVDGDIDILEDFFSQGIKEFDQNAITEPGVTETNRVNITEALKSEKEVIPVDISKYYDIKQTLCKVCDKNCLTEQATRSHMVKIHKIKIPKKRYVDTREKICPHCGIVMKDRGNFYRHVKSHDKREYNCKICTLPFSSEWQLKQHARIHNILLATDKKEKKNKFMCSTCGATFAHSGNLLAHARRHAAPTLACNDCSKAFHRNHDLKRHERTHTGERPYICPVSECSKSFVTKYNLVTHMRKHTAEKPFQCHYCSIKFSKKSNLVKHIQTSTKCIAKRAGLPMKQKRPKLYSCYFCAQKYATKGRLIEHQKRSAACIKKREETENMNRSTIKVQMPYLYPDTPNTEVTPAPMFTIKVQKK